VLEDGLEMAPRQLIWSWSRRVIAISDCTPEFLFGEWHPKKW